MNFTNIYRISLYTMLVFATFVLSVDSVDVSYSMLFPFASAAVAILAFLTVDRNDSMALPVGLINFLSLASIPLAAAEYLLNPADITLPALGHWLVYLQLILMFRPKSVKKDWELFLLGLVQVMVGTVVSQSDSVGISLMIWAILALWVLGLFSLQRDAFRARELNPTSRPDPPRDAELYPGLLNLPFLLSAVRVTATTLALGGVIFLAMPRRQTMPRSRGHDVSTQHLTGFDDEVQLGQLGEILESDNVVMTVALSNERHERLAPNGEPLWRGVTMTKYEAGRWFRQISRRFSSPSITPSNMEAYSSGPQIIQEIKLESNDSNVLFGMRPIIKVNSTRRYNYSSDPELSLVDGTISRMDPRPGVYDYVVTSSEDSSLPQPRERIPDPFVRKNVLLAVPEHIREPLRAIAERVIERLPAERRSDPGAKARALELYLRQDGGFSYTLKLEVVDPTIDPVLDFLINRKSGHCEYFASALTLLLRSVGIPARMVNGFKGGDYNDLARIVYVRQKHAHSWVEAYLGDDADEHSPNWLTLDPTPGNARDESVARVGGFRGNFRQITDLLRFIWVFYVVGYNSDRQNRLLYEPVRALLDEARRGFAMMGEQLQKAHVWLLKILHFESTGSLISPRGFIVSFVGLLLLVGIFQGLHWTTRKLLRWWRGPDEDSAAASLGAVYYRRLAQLLADCGLERPPAETQEEFARRAMVFLKARGSSTETVADVPELVVRAFYRVRFGHLDLLPTDLARLDDRLDALAANLKASQA